MDLTPPRAGGRYFGGELLNGAGSPRDVEDDRPSGQSHACTGRWGIPGTAATTSGAGWPGRGQLLVMVRSRFAPGASARDRCGRS
jgi:hypothetical protein